LLVQLLIYANGLGLSATLRGQFAAVTSLIAEADAIAEATGTRIAPYTAVFLTGFQGSEADATQLIEAVTKDARAAGQGLGIQWCQLVSGILYNSLGRYEKALKEARQASERVPEFFISAWALPELIEAASRTGQTRLAGDALGRLAEATSVAQTDWGQGIYARSRALLNAGEDAEGWCRQAVDRLSRTLLRPELARARRELLASGETARQRTTETHDQLTPQEAQIARLARAGMSNPEIAAQLFPSVRTVEWHLRKVFTKLEISSRLQLQRALPDSASAGPMA
jgi:ATP/maltotriose-dependent transcriptional regulator MalT